MAKPKIKEEIYSRDWIDTYFKFWQTRVEQIEQDAKDRHKNMMLGLKLAAVMGVLLLGMAAGYFLLGWPSGYLDGYKACLSAVSGGKL